MMKPAEFADIWKNEGDSLSHYPPDKLSGLDLTRETIEFLSTGGLPEEAAPYLSFAKVSDDKYEGISTLDTQYDFLEKAFSRYVVIGADGSGNPIAIDSNANDTIVWLDHEDAFASHFLNSSIAQLCGCLVAYRKFVRSVLKQNGPDAYMEAKFTVGHLESLKDDLQLSDSPVIAVAGFWKDEIKMLTATSQPM